MKRVHGAILLSILAVLLLSGKTFATQYDLFGGFVPQGTPTIDGVINSGEWNEMGNRVLYKFFGEDSKVDIHLMWDSKYLYIGADIEDYELWVDSYNPATPWVSTWDDDALKWEIDPNYSRDEYFQPTDRVLAINADGTAYRFDKGDGSGGTAGAQIFDAIIYKAVYSGILNDFTFVNVAEGSTKDTGFVIEAAVSWKNIFGQEFGPYDGYSLGMNITNIEDDTGGALDPAYYAQWKRCKDEITRFMGEENHPENWAEFVLSSNSDTTAPAPVSSIQTISSNAYSTTISFTASGDNSASGYANSYEIKYSTAPLSESSWDSAFIYANNFRPQKSGKTEQFKIIGLTPQTTYYIGVKAVDEIGNKSGISSVSCTTGSATSGDKGYIGIAPGQRYLAWEDKTPLVVIGDNQGMSWPHIRSFYDGQMWNPQLDWVNFYQVDGVQDGRDYLKYLSEHGVNTVRIMAEDLEPLNPVYCAKDMSGGPDNIIYNQDTLNFLSSFLDECATYNINVIIVPFDTFFYSSAFNGWSKTPFSTAKGGPMASSDDFYNPAYSSYVKAVLKKLVDTLGSKKNLLAWDIVNEFDSDEPGIGWTRTSFDTRQTAINDFADYLNSIDPNHLVYLSSVRWDPKFCNHLTADPNASVPGADAAIVLNNNRFDLSSTHMYYHDLRDPNLNSKTNPETIYELAVNDIDNTVSPAARVKQGLQFYYAYTLQPRPYLCSEHGPILFYTTEYDQYFTESEDDQIFHNTIWSYLASGEAGTGLRWPGEMLSSHELSDTMRDHQKSLSNFLNACNVDFCNFSPKQIGQDMKVTGSVPVVATGITDKEQGIIFLAKDTRKQSYSDVSGASLEIHGLTAGASYKFNFWDSYDSTSTTFKSSSTATADYTGKLSLNLPTFSKTIVASFYSISGSLTLTGTVSYNGAPLTVMVLANGKFMFTGSPKGLYSLTVPRDQNGQAVMFAFCAGLAPYSQTVSASGTYNIAMKASSDSDPTLTVESTVTKISDNRVKLSGTVKDGSATVSAMVLANGSNCFSGGDGKFELECVLDASSQIGLMVFCDGRKPYSETITP